MQTDSLIGSNLISLSLVVCLQGGVTLCWVPPLCAAAPWQLWDLRAELKQGQAGRQSAHRDYRPASLQQRTTTMCQTGSRLWWVYGKGLSFSLPEMINLLHLFYCVLQPSFCLYIHHLCIHSVEQAVWVNTAVNGYRTQCSGLRGIMGAFWW